MVPSSTGPAWQRGVAQVPTVDGAAEPGYHDLYRRPEPDPPTPAQTAEPQDETGELPIIAPADEWHWPSASEYWPNDNDVYAPDFDEPSPSPHPPVPNRPATTPGIDELAQTRLWPQREERAGDAFFNRAAPPTPVRDQRSGRWGTRVGLGLIALVLIVAGGFLAYRAVGSVDRTDAVAATPAGNDSGEREQAPPGDPGPADGDESGPVDGATEAAFDMAGDADGVQIRSADLGDVLYRVSASPDGNVRPVVQADGSAVRMTLEPTGRKGGTKVSVVLNAEIRWRVRVGVGVQQGSLDLSGAGPVEKVELAGNASAFDLTLGRPRGTLPVLITGGINQLRVFTADGGPVRVQAKGGAGVVTVGERTRNGVARDSVILSPGWERAKNRIDLDAVAGVGAIRVEQR